MDAFGERVLLRVCCALGFNLRSLRIQTRSVSLLRITLATGVFLGTDRMPKLRLQCENAPSCTRLLTTLGAAVMREIGSDASTERNFTLASLIRPRRSAAQAHR